MIEITIDPPECFDEATERFIRIRKQTLQLEHSLVSLSKWEARYKKSFISNLPKTTEESLFYIRCMTMNKDVDDRIYNFITEAQVKEIVDYIEDPMTATKIAQRTGKKSGESVTSELIYYWMIAMNIPFECQKWHLNRLLMLVNVCQLKSEPAKKMSRSEVLSRNKALNAARRKAYNTSG